MLHVLHIYTLKTIVALREIWKIALINSFKMRGYNDYQYTYTCMYIQIHSLYAAQMYVEIVTVGFHMQYCRYNSSI